LQDLLKVFISLAQQLGCIQQIKRELDTVIESSHDGIWITDVTGTTIKVNRAVERITGLKSGLVMGKNMWELVEEGLIDRSAALEVLKQKEPLTLTQSFANGKQVIVSGLPIFDDKGNISGVVTNLQELTELNELRSKLELARRLTERYKKEIDALRCRKVNAEQIVARSKAMQNVLDVACKVSQVKTNVLILGKTGVGKESIARQIHMSGRQNGSFIKINCQAIPTGVLRPILFGYDPVDSRKYGTRGEKGLWEMAHEGTLFIKEVADLPPDLQEKLLGVIRMQEKVRTGVTEPENNINVRIIASSNKDLKKMIRKGKFKKDLYDSLSTVTIPIPPLHKRKEDIPVLIQHYTRVYNKMYKLKKGFSVKTMELLVDYEWPENVRELANLVERLLITVEHKLILPKHLPAYICKNIGAKGTNNFKTLKEAVAELEFELIKNAVDMYGSTYKAASILGVSQPTVVRKLHKYAKNTLEMANTSMVKDN